MQHLLFSCFVSKWMLVSVQCVLHWSIRIFFSMKAKIWKIWTFFTIIYNLMLLHLSLCLCAIVSERQVDTYIYIQRLFYWQRHNLCKHCPPNVKHSCYRCLFFFYTLLEITCLDMHWFCFMLVLCSSTAFVKSQRSV